MKKKIKCLLISLLIPGLGYLLAGESRKFYVTILVFYLAVILGSLFKLYPVFQGFVSISLLLLSLHFGTAVDAAFRRPNLGKHQRDGFLKWTLITVFFLSTVTGFSHSALVMGFDRVSMAVPVMEPEILKGDQLLVDTWAYKSERPQSGDIVVHSFMGQKGLFLNRIIAVAGDTIEISDGKVFINGIFKQEEYVNPVNATREESRALRPVIIPKDQYFVMGDNRDKSFGDSRFNGPIQLTDVRGMAGYILYSPDFSRLGKRLE